MQQENTKLQVCEYIKAAYDTVPVVEQDHFLNEIECFCKKLKRKEPKNVSEFLQNIHGGSRLYICAPYEANGIIHTYQLEWDNEKHKYYIPGEKSIEDAVKIIRAVAARAALPEFCICVEFDELIDAGAEGLTLGERTYSEKEKL